MNQKAGQGQRTDRGSAGTAAVRQTGAPTAHVDAVARTGDSSALCSDDIHSILNTALVAEQIATTFYYTALTSFGVMHNRALGGSSTDPNNPGLPPNGNPPHVRYLQAALDAEHRHAQLLARAGAISAFGHFYFPPTTFTTLGSSLDRASFLGVMDILETVLMGVHIGASVCRGDDVPGDRDGAAALDHTDRQHREALTQRRRVQRQGQAALSGWPERQHPPEQRREAQPHIDLPPAGAALIARIITPFAQLLPLGIIARPQQRGQERSHGGQAAGLGEHYSIAPIRQRPRLCWRHLREAA